MLFLRLVAVVPPRPMTIIRCVPLLVVLVTSNASLASAQNTQCDASQFDALTNMWKLEPDREHPPGSGR